MDYNIEEPVLFDNVTTFPVFKNNRDYKKYNFELNIFKTFKKFIVTTLNGNKYEFGGSVDNIDFATSSNGITSASSWHLSKITSPNGNYINFEYTTGGIIFVQKKANYFYASTSSEDDQNFCSLTRNDSDDGISMALIHPKYLKKITTSTEQIINFVTSKSTELDYDNWNTIYATHPNVIKSLLPNITWNADRLDDNYYLKLDRIEIPNLKYINLFYSNSTAQRLKLLGLSLTPALGIDSIPSSLNDSLNISKYIFSYNSVTLPKYNSRLTDNWGFYNNKDFSTISFNKYSTMFNFRQPDINYAKAEILERITYPTGGVSVFDYELNKYSKIISRLEVNVAPFSIVNSSDNAGGLRIKKITNYSNINDLTKRTEKTFLYENADGSSSGIPSGIPVYSQEGNQHINYKNSGWSGLMHYSTDVDYTVHYYMYSQNILLPLSTTNGNHITYSRVKELESDGSYTVYTYTNHESYPDEVPLQVITNMDSRLIIDAFTSKELERGLLKSVEIYNSNNKPVQKSIFEYNNNADRYNNYVRTINRYSLSGGTCSSDFLRYSANKIYTFFPYLKTKTETKYDLNGENLVINTADYTYNQNNLIQTITTLNSRNEIFKSLMKYSGDNFSTSSIYNTMKNKNMLNYPVEKTSFKSNQITGSELTMYKETPGLNSTTLYVPDKKYKMELASSIPGYLPFDGLERDSHYSSLSEFEMVNYDTRGNITEIKNRDGINTTYLWGYNYQYPIAEINNATYNQIKSALGLDPETIAASEIPDLSKIGEIRKSLPNAQVTTYTYMPLIGMTSSTDPNNITTYYIYDSFGRLIETYIIDGSVKNILHKYDYHYKN